MSDSVPRRPQQGWEGGDCWRGDLGGASINEIHSFPPLSGIWWPIVRGHRGRSDAICWHVLSSRKLPIPPRPLASKKTRGGKGSLLFHVTHTARWTASITSHHTINIREASASVCINNLRSERKSESAGSMRANRLWDYAEIYLCQSLLFITLEDKLILVYRARFSLTSALRHESLCSCINLCKFITFDITKNLEKQKLNISAVKPQHAQWEWTDLFLISLAGQLSAKREEGVLFNFLKKSSLLTLTT